MESLVAALVSLGVIGMILLGYAWLSRRIQRRHLGHSFMGPIEDIYNPAARRQEIALDTRADTDARPPTGSTTDSSESG